MCLIHALNKKGSLKDMNRFVVIECVMTTTMYELLLVLLLLCMLRSTRAISLVPRYLHKTFPPHSCPVASVATVASVFVPSRLFMTSSSDEVTKAVAAAQAYRTSDKDGAGPATVFDKILSGEWPSNKVYEDDDCLAFRDIAPQAPVHIVIIPKDRNGLTQLSQAKTEAHKQMLGHLLFVAQQLGQQECPQGFRVVINDGEQGAQSVYHLHLHVLGGRQMEWPPG